MDNTVKTLEDFSNHPLERLQLSRLLQAVEGLDKQQLTWASGYLAGLGVLEPTVAKAADQVPGVTILYATQGGNARSVAEAVNQLLDYLHRTGVLQAGYQPVALEA
ncbi:MAG: hypothetical protein ABW077_12620 [Candidatus Thiodiazotropha endolucinida]